MRIKTEMENIFLIKNIFLIINAINIFSAGGDKLVEVMTVASVPSTLVKCLYLFFDLAATEGEEEESSGAASSSPEHEAEFTARERRILLQKMFMQVLLRLCGHKVINLKKIFLRFKNI